MTRILPIAFFVSALAGCGGSTTNTGAGGAGPTSPSAVHGTVTNGLLPLASASVQLYGVGVAGLQSSATPLLSAPVSTDNTGAFSFALPTCAGATEVYLVSTGGNSGAGANPATILLSAIGPCTSLSSSSTFHIDEATTVASAFALAPFLADATHLGSGSNSVGLTNAFTLIHSLVDASTATVPGPSLAVNVTAPTAALNTLANILAGCVKSAANCAALFTATSSSDTLGATVQIARQPGAFTSLFPLASAYAPYTPALSVAPADWTLSLRIAANGLAAPYGLAIDAAGNAWVANEGGAAISELSPAGALLTTVSASGLLAPRAISIDRTGNLWVASTGSDAVFKFSNVGAALLKVSAGLPAPSAIALDSAGNAWVASSAANSITELSNSGVIVTTNNTLSGPSGIALDSSGNVWTANPGASNIVELSHSGSQIGTFTDGVTQAPAALAFDAAANLWFTGSVPSAATVQGAVSQLSATGAAASPNLSVSAWPFGISSSGSDIWVTNGTSNGGLLLFRAGNTAPVSSSSGFGSLNMPMGVAVDPSGNVWTANSGDNTISIFLGLTTPAITPLAMNVGP